ncbi:leucine rich repeat-containing protein [Toxoplasma gondii VAND]|uniref:Leucine rich repeat-containing protein n=1 Tax=Toxoplasma gondii VAND TaxID=933077 RepID=A0A086QHZ5_TOXGO|nr:leucine rich repeat-containing protein [Toxoplasma gondii VAND]
MAGSEVAQSSEDEGKPRMPTSLDEALEFEESEMESGFEPSEKSDEKTSHPTRVLWPVSQTEEATASPLSPVGGSSNADSQQRTLKPGNGTSGAGGFASSSPSGVESKDYAKLLFPELSVDTCVDFSDDGDEKERPLSESTVQKLIGDEKPEEVEILVARGQKLTTLDRAKGACDWQVFKTLSTLSLSHNKLTDITPLLVLAPTLADVNLSFNRITDISPIFACKALRRLWAAHNHVRCIRGIRNCQGLEILNLFQNCLRSPFSSLVNELSHLPGLLELDLDANPFLSASPSDSDHSFQDSPPLGRTALRSDQNGQAETSAHPDAKTQPASSVSTVSFSLQDSKNKLDLLLQCCPTLRLLGGVPVSRLKPPTQILSAFKDLACSSKRSRDPSEGEPHSTDLHSSPCSLRDGFLSGSPAKCLRTAQSTHPPVSSDASSPRARGSSQEASSPTGSLKTELGDERDSAGDAFGSGQEEDMLWDEAPEEAEQPSLASLKRTVKLLKQENRNMYDLMEENARLRMQLRLGPFRLPASARRKVPLLAPHNLLVTTPAFSGPGLRCFSARDVESSEMKVKTSVAEEAFAVKLSQPRPNTAMPSFLPAADSSNDERESSSPSHPRPSAGSTAASVESPLLPRKALGRQVSCEPRQKAEVCFRSVDVPDVARSTLPLMGEEGEGLKCGSTDGAGDEGDEEKGRARMRGSLEDEGESKENAQGEEEDSRAAQEAREAEADMLRWENGVLRKRLERLVAYVELLRVDLDASRKTRKPTNASSENPQASTFPKSSGNARHSFSASAPLNKSKCALTMLTSSPHSPSALLSARDVETRFPDAEAPSLSLNDDEFSPSSLFSLLVDPPVTKAASRASKASLALARTEADRAARGCTQSEKQWLDATQKTDGEKQHTYLTAYRQAAGEEAELDSLQTRPTGDSGEGDAENGAEGEEEEEQVPEKREDSEFGAVIGEEGSDADLEALLKRNEENLKALRRDLRETEEMLSRPASATSSTPLRFHPEFSFSSPSTVLDDDPPRQPPASSQRPPPLPRPATKQSATKSIKLDKGASPSPFASRSLHSTNSSNSCISSQSSRTSLSPLTSFACPQSTRPPTKSQSAEAATRAALSMRLARRFGPPATAGEKKGGKKEEKKEEKKATTALLSSRLASSLPSAGGRGQKSSCLLVSENPLPRPKSPQRRTKASPAPTVTDRMRERSSGKELPRRESEESRPSAGSFSRQPPGLQGDTNALKQKQRVYPPLPADALPPPHSLASLLSKRFVTEPAAQRESGTPCSPSQRIDQPADAR